MEVDIKKLLHQDLLGVKPTKLCTCSENMLQENKFVKSLAASHTLVDGRIQVKMKPIGMFTHVLMNIFFGTKIHVFLNLSIVLGNVGTVVIPPPVLKLLILLRLSHNLRSRRVFILNG